MLRISNLNINVKLEDRLQRPIVNVDAFTTACCNLDLWPLAPESNQVISKG